MGRVRKENITGDDTTPDEDNVNGSNVISNHSMKLRSMIQHANVTYTLANFD